MKKINSIGYGLAILGVAAVFTIAVPAVAYWVWILTGISAFRWVSGISLLIGLLTLLFLIVLLTIEHFQDKRINRFFARNANMKISLPSGLYECQSCGNRLVKPEQQSCPGCGVIFENRHNDKRSI